MRFVFSENGERLDIPANWSCLPPGDAAVTRKLKLLGPTWTAQRKKGNKTFSDGVWAPTENIELAKKLTDEKRATPEHKKQLEASRRRRDEKQNEYVHEFYETLLDWLKFHPRYAEIAKELARKICDHATPVGSGTVARTQRISIEERASAATIAWMRHQTTNYDEMNIARIKGKRREVRRNLAEQSSQILKSYRDGDEIDLTNCPLFNALKNCTDN